MCVKQKCNNVQKYDIMVISVDSYDSFTGFWLIFCHPDPHSGGQNYADPDPSLGVGFFLSIETVGYARWLPLFPENVRLREGSGQKLWTRLGIHSGKFTFSWQKKL